MKLNDFKGFEKRLFTEEERRLLPKEKWKKFYNQQSYFFNAPIREPKTIAEYQLDHYALWMVISTFRLACNPAYRTVLAATTAMPACIGMNGGNLTRVYVQMIVLS